MKLNYKTYGHGSPLFILHGLFGMGDNWRTFARMTEDRLTSVTVDLRNHGRSPHSPDMSFTDMAEDVVELMGDMGLSSAAVMGHSLGGKVAMTMALEHPNRVEHLLVVDMAPRRYEPHHTDIIRAIAAVTNSDFDSRGAVEAKLLDTLDRDISVVQFLMKNLGRDDDGRLSWKSNMPGIIEAYPQIMESITSPRPYEGPVTFIRGEKSRYIRDDDMPGILDLFPRAELRTVPDAGHWVHADQPQLFAEVVLDALAGAAD